MASWRSICPSEMERALALATWPLLLMVWLQPGCWTRQGCGSKLGRVLGGARLVQMGVLLTAPGPPTAAIPEFCGTPSPTQLPRLVLRGAVRLLKPGRPSRTALPHPKRP